MNPLPATATDADLIAYVDQWAALMEVEDYAAAHAWTDHIPVYPWTPDLMRQAVERYGHRITVAGEARRDVHNGVPVERVPCREVDRLDSTDAGYNFAGGIWYGLNIDGATSDVTATFVLVRVPDGLVLWLEDICIR